MDGGPAGRLPRTPLGTLMRPLGIHIRVWGMGTILYMAISHRCSTVLRRVSRPILRLRFHQPLKRHRPIHLRALLPCNSSNHKCLWGKANNNLALLIHCHQT